MLRLSENVIYESSALLRRLLRYSYLSVDELCGTSLSSINPREIWNLAVECKWVSLDGSIPILTTKGRLIEKLEEQQKHEDCMRTMLADYIVFVRPIWANRIPAGRKEATVFMTKDERACFTGALLLEMNPNEGAVKWWDEVSSSIRDEAQKKKTEIGRNGEQRTIEYESKRTGISPEWVSVDSNVAGYDIKSVIEAGQIEPLLIEVKTSEKTIECADFFVTSNEWNTAIMTKHYMFYLWCIHDENVKLAKISPDSLRKYIPTNNLTGKWESARIPFLGFQDLFVEI